MSPNTIRKGLAELTARESNPRAVIDPRLRREGGGRKRSSEADPKLLETLEWLVEPLTRGDPCSPLRWTCKSTTNLAEELSRMGHPVSPRTVGRLLNADGFSLQSNRKTKEGESHPDRNAQFEFINGTVKRFQKRGQPVISVDTKKKELVGNLSQNEGWVSVGIDHDTARFAAQAIHRWWKKMGLKRYRNARELLITADGGGSNGSRSRLWKVALQDLAIRLGIPVRVCHFPPGTSKWNKIEHRMFCHITQNWRGRPLVSHEVIIQLIAGTTTKTGLKIRAELDTRHYPTGTQISDAELAALNLKPSDFHGEWNYTLLPSLK